MNRQVWIKRYDDPAPCRSARNHLLWLTRLEADVHLPALYSSSDSHHLITEHLGSRHPGPDHLTQVAATLGCLHAAAHLKELHRARLHQPFRTNELLIADFVSPRREVLHHINLDVAALPAAIYKDANPRNFLLTDTGVALLDFDHLTLAPFGYDLAKLIVTTAMTHGALDEAAIHTALDTYNRHTTRVSPDVACPLNRLYAFAEIHHLLTARYLGRNGYRHAWPDVRPAGTTTP